MAYFVNTKESVVLITDMEDDESFEVRGGQVVDVNSVAGLDSSRQWKKFVSLGIMKEISEEQKDRLENVVDKEVSAESSPSASDHNDAIMIDLTEELNDLHGHEDAVNATVAEANDGVSTHNHSPRENVDSSNVAPTQATHANVGDDQVGGKTTPEKAELKKLTEETGQIFVELEEIKDNSH